MDKGGEGGSNPAVAAVAIAKIKSADIAAERRSLFPARAYFSESLTEVNLVPSWGPMP
jgi:hypothetical protein